MHRADTRITRITSLEVEILKSFQVISRMSLHYKGEIIEENAKVLEYYIRGGELSGSIQIETGIKF